MEHRLQMRLGLLSSLWVLPSSLQFSPSFRWWQWEWHSPSLHCSSCGPMCMRRGAKNRGPEGDELFYKKRKVEWGIILLVIIERSFLDWRWWWCSSGVSFVRKSSFGVSAGSFPFNHFIWLSEWYFSPQLSTSWLRQSTTSRKMRGAEAKKSQKIDFSFLRWCWCNH